VIFFLIKGLAFIGVEYHKTYMFLRNNCPCCTEQTNLNNLWWVYSYNNSTYSGLGNLDMRRVSIWSHNHQKLKCIVKLTETSKSTNDFRLETICKR